MRTTRLSLVIAAGMLFLLVASENLSNTQSKLPNPVAVFIGPEYFQSGGRNFTRYMYQIDNASAYPSELFAASPKLPPCGSNTQAARMWVDIYELNGKRLNGFCALGGSRDLNRLWFALQSEIIPPSWIYIEFTDRQTGLKYKSNLAESVQ